MNANVTLFVSFIVCVGIIFGVLKIIEISADLRYLRSLHDPGTKPVNKVTETLVFMACAFGGAFLIILLLSGRI